MTASLRPMRKHELRCIREFRVTTTSRLEAIKMQLRTKPNHPLEAHYQETLHELDDQIEKLDHTNPQEKLHNFENNHESES